MRLRRGARAASFADHGLRPARRGPPGPGRRPCGRRLLRAIVLASAAGVTWPAMAADWPDSAAWLQGAAAEWQAAQRAYRQGSASTSLLVDNDSYLHDGKDGFYTSGLRLSRQYRIAVAGDERSSADAGRTAGSIGSAASTATITYGWRLGQDLYTASDIKLPPDKVAAPDHPYAGWLYGGVFRLQESSDGRALSLGIDLGCLGACAGGEASQNAFHRLLHQPHAQGWSRQVRNAPGLLLHGLSVPLRWQLAPGLDLRPALQVRFGNIHADAAASLVLRAGDLQADPLLAGLPVGAAALAGSAPAAAAAATNATNATNATPGAAFQGFVRLQARAVAHDASLQGAWLTHDSPHTVTPKRLVGEIEVGLQWRHPGWLLSASIVRSGSEIADLPEALGAQRYARLRLTVGD